MYIWAPLFVSGSSFLLFDAEVMLSLFPSEITFVFVVSILYCRFVLYHSAKLGSRSAVAGY